MRARAHTAIYGNTRIVRHFCQPCNGYYFVLRGLLACCGRRPTDAPDRFMVIVPPRRRKPTPWVQEKILARQHSRCLYCLLPFGEIVEREGREFVLRVAWDHFVPFSVAADNADENFVASCQICNSIKRDRLFQSPEECADWLKRKREQLGYAVLKLPPTLPSD